MPTSTPHQILKVWMGFWKDPDIFVDTLSFLEVTREQEQKLLNSGQNSRSKDPPNGTVSPFFRLKNSGCGPSPAYQVPPLHCPVGETWGLASGECPQLTSSLRRGVKPTSQ